MFKQGYLFNFFNSSCFDLCDLLFFCFLYNVKFFSYVFVFFFHIAHLFYYSVE
uniref:Uncharacterized protein n=1 Tax=Anguilla anguilla TaxID=7936 RepID=A0A0E9R114_ANGAN